MNTCTYDLLNLDQTLLKIAWNWQEIPVSGTLGYDFSVPVFVRLQKSREIGSTKVSVPNKLAQNLRFLSFG